MTEGFGKAKYGGTGGFKAYDLKTDSQGGSLTYLYRVLPPMKSLSTSGTWAIYYGQHFGYAGVDPKDPQQTKQRPFKCIEEFNFRTKMITKACPECNLIASKKAALEAKTVKVKADISNTAEMVDNLLAADNAWLSGKGGHNCQRQWHMNVMAPSGEFGVLRMSHEVKKLMEGAIKEAKDVWGIDPTDLDQGVWFKFVRTGKKMLVQTTVTIDMQMDKDPTGKSRGQIPKPAPLTPAQIEQALQECPDLTEVVRTLSEKQITLLTKCSGDPNEVDEIWAMGEAVAPTSSVSTPAPRLAPEPVPQPKPAPVVAPAPKSEPVPAAPVAVEDPKVALLKTMGFSETQIAAMMAMVPSKPAAEPVAAVPAPITASAGPAPAVPATTPSEVPGGLSKDQFYDLFKKT